MAPHVARRMRMDAPRDEASATFQLMVAGSSVELALALPSRLVMSCHVVLAKCRPEDRDIS